MDVLPKRVLLVDDDPDVVETVGTALESRGFAVIVARDGVEGLARAERDRPDLILLDVVMPRRSGFSLLNLLHRAGNSLPIIMMSGTDDSRHREFAEARGAREFVCKPFDVDVLITKVEVILAAV